MKTLLFLLLITAALTFAQHNGTNTTPPPAYSTTVLKFGTGSLTSLSGTQYVNLPYGAVAFPAASNFTIELWVNTPTGSCTNYPIAIGGTDGSWFISGLNGVINVEFPNITGGMPVVGTKALCDGQWHHVAVVLSGGGTTLGLWVDGANANSGGVPQTGLGPIGAIPNVTPNTGTTLGYFNRTTVHFWPGYIDEVSIWNYAKWTSTFAPPTLPYTGFETGLAALYHLDGNPLDSYLNSTTIQYNAVSTAAPANNQALIYQSGSSSYVPETINTLQAGLGTSVTGTAALQVNTSMHVRCVGLGTTACPGTTTDTLQNSDCGGLVTYNAASTAVAVPQPTPTLNFASGCPITLRNYGSSSLNLTPPSTVSIGGRSAGTAYPVTSFCLLISDGTNWQLGACN